MSKNKNHALVIKATNKLKLWHLKYGHLNVKRIKLLFQKEMVHGLPKIESLSLCEACIYGCRHPFLSSVFMIIFRLLKIFFSF